MPESRDPDRLSLVVPVYNEAESLAQLVREIDAGLQPLGQPYEIIFVDDGSRDDSWSTIQSLASSHPKVRGIRFRRNFGKAAALQAGFRAARGSIVLTLDADLQDDPKEIPRFVAAVKGGQDVVSGWKKIRHDPWHKVFPSRVFNTMVSRLTGVTLHDHNCGFKAYRAEVLNEVRLYGELHRFVPVLAHRRGFRVGELIIEHRKRQFGHSKYGWRRFTKGFLDLLSVHFVTAYGDRPQHLLGSWGLSAGLVGLLGLALVLMNLIMQQLWSSVGLGPFGLLLLTLFSLAALGLGAQCLLTGVLAELLVHHRSADHEPYAIADQTFETASP